MPDAQKTTKRVKNWDIPVRGVKFVNTVMKSNGGILKHLMQTRNPVCHWCRCRLSPAALLRHDSATVDHILPRDRGGANANGLFKNHVLSCRQDNSLRAEAGHCIAALRCAEAVIGDKPEPGSVIRWLYTKKRTVSEEDMLAAEPYFNGHIFTRYGRIQWRRSSVWQDLIAKQSGLCFWCNRPLDDTLPDDRSRPPPAYPTIEYVVQLSNGGRDVLTNIKVAHYACNQEFTDKNPNKE